MSSEPTPVLLREGSIWADLGQKGIIAMSPFQDRPKIYKNRGAVSVKKIGKKFSDAEAFYFWISKSIDSEFESASRVSSSVNRKLHLYHRGINYNNSDGHFERSEKTLSYLFRYPHPALNGLSYGERLFQSLSENGCIPSCGNILEVGAGLGLHTKGFLSLMKEKTLDSYRNTTYINLDLAPGLLESQRRENVTVYQKHPFVQADAVKIPFADLTFDLIIANEVIADFSVEKVSKIRARNCSYINKYGLKIDDAAPLFLINAGAIIFIEELYRILKPGGKAVVIEYGDEYHYPIETILPDHTEYSIHFGHLICTAEQLGFKVQYKNLLEFLKFRPSVKVITGNSLVLLQRLMKHLNHRLSSFAYTRQMLKKEIKTFYNKIHNLQFEKIEKLATLFRLQEFKALILEK
jgi:ubiquinone/menaquinone biosynthesis C-methylase UbiE